MVLTPATRSIAPPTAGIASGAPVDQLARSPFSATCIAPSTQMSRCPPRIIEKLSAWWKKAAPGIVEMRFLPALISSGSPPSSPTGPMPSSPFSVW